VWKEVTWRDVEKGTMAEGARMGVEPQFSGWEIGSPPRATFLNPPDLGARAAQRRGGRPEPAAFPRWVGLAASRAGARLPGGQPRKDPRGSTLV
jgi:hypothetical protein